MSKGKGPKEEPIRVKVTDSSISTSLSGFMSIGLRSERTRTAELPIPKALIAAQAIDEMRKKAHAYSEDSEIIQEGQDKLIRILAGKLRERRRKESDSVIVDTKELAAEQGFPYNQKLNYQKLAFRRWLKYLPENLRQRYFAAAEYLTPFSNLLNSETKPDAKQIEEFRAQINYVRNLLETNIPEDPEPFELNAALPESLRELISYLKFIDIRINQDFVELDDAEIIQKLKKYAVVFSEEIDQIQDPDTRQLSKEIHNELIYAKETDNAKDLISIFKAQLSKFKAWTIVVPHEVPGELIQIMGEPEKLFQKWDEMLRDPSDANLEKIMNELLLFTEHSQVLLNSFGKPLTDRILDNLPEDTKNMIVKMVNESKEILALLNCIFPDRDGKYDKAILRVLEKAINKQHALSILLNEEYNKYYEDEELDLDADFDFDGPAPVSAPEPEPTQVQTLREPTQTQKVISATQEVDIQFFNLIQDDKDEDLYAEMIKQYSLPLGRALRELSSSLQVAQQESLNGEIGDQIADPIEKVKEVLQRLSISALRLSDKNIMMYEVFPEMKAKIDKHRKQREKVVNFNEEMNEELINFGEMFEALNTGKRTNLALVLSMFDALVKLMNRHYCLEDLLSDVKEIEWAKLKAELELFMTQRELQSRITIKEISVKVSNFMTGIEKLAEMKFNPLLIDHDKEKINSASQSISNAQTTLEAVLDTVGITKEYQEKEGLKVVINIDNYRSTIEQISRLLKFSSAALFNCMDRNREEVDQVMWILDFLTTRIDDLTSEDLLDEEKMVELKLQFAAVETNLQTLPIRLQI